MDFNEVISKRRNQKRRIKQLCAAIKNTFKLSIDFIWVT
jgi:hypothetical protein